METPPIQYVKTSDGVSIAYYAIGDGAALPLVWVELPSQLQLEQKLFPTQARIYNTISRIGKLVRYDHRGFGLSDRSITKFPLDDMVKDLEAVVDKLELSTFILIGAGGFTGLVAIKYAATHPERVAKLAIGPQAYIPAAQHQQYLALMHPGSDWQFVSEAISRLALGWDDEGTSRSLAAWFRESSTYETFKAFWRDVENWDVRDLLPAVESPTLIVAYSAGRTGSMVQAREMTSLMPNAQLFLADGATYEERTSSYEAAVASFLYGPAASVRAEPDRPAPSGTAIILFADIVDSTALTERLGDAAFREKARDLDTTMRNIIREHSGAAIEGKLLGDGALAVFTSARWAIEAALACGRAGADGELPLHLGIHAGDVIREDNNVYGGAVNIAARISGLSAPGEVLVSDTVRSLARTSAAVEFVDRGEKTLKGIEEPVRIWAVREGE